MDDERQEKLRAVIDALQKEMDKNLMAHEKRINASIASIYRRESIRSLQLVMLFLSIGKDWDN